jgi:sphingomyelin phosphodiesterase acid-like 3
MPAIAFVASFRRSVARLRSFVCGAAVCGFLACVLGVPLPVRAADPWLFVNDVHYDPTVREAYPVTYGDTNEALLESTLREMHRIAPNPPVIVMAGDFLAHHFKRSTAAPTMVALAQRFRRSFPRAQFVMALGNEDSPCGDYAIAANSRFLRVVAQAWAPLVNRNGVAPEFARTFPHHGFYTTKLPLAGVRAVVVDNAFWSAIYHDGCGVGGRPTPESFDELERALSSGGTERWWLVMHIPPGIDASSTVLRAHRLAIVPFLRPAPRDAVLGLIGDPARRIEVVITGHVHRFAYRLIERKNSPAVPLLVSPAVSPVLGNAPSFLSADIAPNGVIRNLEEHSFVYGRWRDLGGLGTLGVSEFSGPALEKLQRRLEHDPALREKFATLYMGAGPFNEIDERNWRSYWCASTEYSSTAYRDCLDQGGFSFLTRRGVVVVAVAAGGGAVVLAAVGGGIMVLVRRRRAAARNAG